MRIATPRELKSGKWFVQLRINGQSFSHTAPTKRECELYAMQIRSKYTGEIIQCDLTLSEAIDVYIASRSNVLSPSTIEGYRNIQRNRFQAIQNRKLTSIKNWKAVVNDEAKIVSAKTVQNAWMLVASVLKDNNLPVPDLNLPQIVKNEHEFLDPDQIRIFLDAIDGDKYELPILLGLHGLRRSEVLALTKDSIANGVIHVKGSVVHDGKEFVRKPTNKNTASQRNVPVLIDKITELAEKSETEALCPWNPSIIYKKVNKICKENNLPEIGFHGLRHSFASLCYYLGLSEMETMRLGGWKDPEVMRKIYTHLAQKQLSVGEQKLRDFFVSIR